MEQREIKLWHIVVDDIISTNLCRLKNAIDIKDIIDYLIEKKVVTLDYWMGLKSKQIPESERTAELLWFLTKSNREKFDHFLESLIKIDRYDLYDDLIEEKEKAWLKALKEKEGYERKPKHAGSEHHEAAVVKQHPYNNKTHTNEAQELGELLKNRIKELEQTVKAQNETIKKNKQEQRGLKHTPSSRIEASSTTGQHSKEQCASTCELNSLRREFESKWTTSQEKMEDMKETIERLKKDKVHTKEYKIVKNEGRSQTMTTTSEQNKQIEMMRNEIAKKDMHIQKVTREKEDKEIELKQIKKILDQTESDKKVIEQKNKALLARCSMTPNTSKVSRVSSFQKT